MTDLQATRYIGCLPAFTWANWSVHRLGNGKQNSELVNFVLESRLPFALVRCIEKRPQKSETGIKDGFDEKRNTNFRLEHSDREKRGRFPLDLNFQKFGNGGQCNGNFLGKFPESPRTFEFQKCEPINRTFSKFREQSYMDARLSYFLKTLIHSSLEVPENSEREFWLNEKRPGLPFKTFRPDFPEFFINGKQPVLPFCGCYGIALHFT